MEVANFCKQSSVVRVHELEYLPPRMAWELFCSKIFQHDDEFGGICPPELENLSRKIVERCQGLPLAIVAIAGLLSTKPKTVDEWRKLHDSFSFELESNPKLISITKALSLSYNDLPYYLKSCFLYIGMYPEDYPIKCSRLILQWIAEGFVTPKGDETVEVVAEEYLTELIHRSLVQISRSSLSGKVKECCIHDFLREMSLQKIQELNFGQVLSQSETSFTEGSRRISIIKSSPFDVLEDCYNSRVRGILFFETYGPGYASYLPECGFHANYKLLKVLDLEGIRVDRISKSIGNLFHLKYFSVANSIVKMIPRCIEKLQNLETLNLKNTLVNELPVEINRLHKLRHLLASKGTKLQEGIGSLTCLQKLYDVNYHYKIGSGGGAADEQMLELRKLTQLRKLGVCNLKRGDGESLCECINEMKHLESLMVTADYLVGDYVDLESLSSPPEFAEAVFGWTIIEVAWMDHKTMKSSETRNSAFVSGR
ncbi:disease resistance protein RPM1-like isoform X1 [Ziziphus jujuba]|uniref:Disease resistance protein RPM1-like isoform X1 n=2 Tax=Ziziphus jujuba TaxID=326968 RepID=A0A6P4B449_ZIZJJ|nr:disease resistance protein RPM1-like isoform X1 [Ziziphus jujuba]XP_060672942.1 disease resistance protein RPM1-like isoform X1 [Ziziphus jujuba]